MPRVRIDIAGFYYSVTAEYKNQPTIRDMMEIIEQRGRIPTDNKTEAKLKYESNERGFLSRLQVDFFTAPKSRQVGERLPDGFPNLPACSIAAMDETRIMTAAGVAELTWQYYVNAATFGPDGIATVGAALNQEPASGDKGLRLVKNFSHFKLTQDCVVTWRLIAIMVGGDPITNAAEV